MPTLLHPTHRVFATGRFVLVFVALSFALFLPSAANAQGWDPEPWWLDPDAGVGLINTHFNGPGIVCSGATNEFAVGSGNGDCFSRGVKWSGTRPNGKEVLATTYIPIAGSKEKFYLLVVDKRCVTVDGLPVWATDGDKIAYDYNNVADRRKISLTFHLAETYKVQGAPRGVDLAGTLLFVISGFSVYYEGGSVRLCKKAKQDVLVINPNAPYTATIGELVGNRYPDCTFGGLNGNVLPYSIPAVSEATSYIWRIFNGVGYNLNARFPNGSTTIATTTPDVPITYQSVSGYQQGTLRVDAINPCGKIVSRTFNMFRSPVSSSVTSAGNIGCAQCFSAPSGSNYQWSLAGTPPPDLYIDGSTTGPVACVRSYSAQSVSGYLQVSYNGGCAGERLSGGTSFYLIPCYGGRLSVERTVVESVSPNPASDVLNVAFPSDKYEVLLTDMLGKQVCYQTATDYECQVKVSHLSNGVYILQIRDNTNTVPPSKHRVVVAH